MSGEIIERLTSLDMCLLPWKELKGRKAFVRFAVNEKFTHSNILVWWHKGWHRPRRNSLWDGVIFETKEDAMTSLDHTLRQEGYLLLEEHPKLMLLV